MRDTRATYPHGTCECASGRIFGPGGCCGGTGPAAYEVTRHGKRIKVCTCCDLGDDDDKVCLVTKADSPAVYFEHDALGALVLASRLADEAADDEDEGEECECEVCQDRRVRTVCDCGCESESKID